MQTQKIKKITRENFKGTVYNIGTLPNHNYFADNILVHNCYKSNTTKGRNIHINKPDFYVDTK